MVQKKINRTTTYGLVSVRDSLINYSFHRLQFDFGVTIYGIISSNPLEIAVGILSLKLGLSNKILIGLIIGFLI